MKRAAKLILILSIIFLITGILFASVLFSNPNNSSPISEPSAQAFGAVSATPLVGTALSSTFSETALVSNADSANPSPVSDSDSFTARPALFLLQSGNLSAALPVPNGFAVSPFSASNSDSFTARPAPFSLQSGNLSAALSVPNGFAVSPFSASNSDSFTARPAPVSDTYNLTARPAPFSLQSGNLSAAVSTPHVVIGDNIWLLNGDGEKLFLLPKTYYAEITSLDETYYFVTFNGISGKVPKNSVRSVGYHTQASGTSESLKIDDAYAEFTRLSLKERPDRSSKTVTEMPTKDSFTFVGLYPKEEEVWYAVRYNEFFGYLRATLTSKKEMTFPDFVPEVEPPDDNAATTDPVPGGSDSAIEKEGFNPLTVVLVVGLTLPAIFIIVLLFKKDPKKPKRFD